MWCLFNRGTWVSLLWKLTTKTFTNHDIIIIAYTFYIKPIAFQRCFSFPLQPHTLNKCDYNYYLPKQKCGYNLVGIIYYFIKFLRIEDSKVENNTTTNNNNIKSHKIINTVLFIKTKLYVYLAKLPIMWAPKLGWKSQLLTFFFFS